MGVSRNPVARVEYVRRVKNVCSSVVYEIFPDGQEIFSECGDYEVRWYPFTPSDYELRAARRLGVQGTGQSGQQAVIDLDTRPRIR